MAKSKYVIAAIFIGFSASIAAECHNNIPGHYIDRFTDNGDGTVTDRLTGLDWMRCHHETRWNSFNKFCEFELNVQEQEQTNPLTWPEALLEADKANTDSQYGLGYTDWRMPNIKEIASIQDLGCSNLRQIAIDEAVFPRASTSRHWSSTPYRFRIGESADYPEAWAFTFLYLNFGASHHSVKDFLPNIDPLDQDVVTGVVRLVRGGN